MYYDYPPVFHEVELHFFFLSLFACCNPNHESPNSPSKLVVHEATNPWQQASAGFTQAAKPSVPSALCMFSPYAAVAQLVVRNSNQSNAYWIRISHRVRVVVIFCDRSSVFQGHGLDKLSNVRKPNKGFSLRPLVLIISVAVKRLYKTN